MRALPAILLILTCSATLRAQSIPDGLVVTKEQHDRWFLNLEKAPKSEQLDLIRQRILLDTNIYIQQSHADRLSIDSERGNERGTRTQGYGRPLLVFNTTHVAAITNKTTSNSILKLAHFLTDKRIASVSTMKGAKAAALYGSRAMWGVILMTTEDKKTLRLIKKIDLGGDY